MAFESPMGWSLRIATRRIHRQTHLRERQLLYLNDPWGAQLVQVHQQIRAARSESGQGLQLVLLMSRRRGIRIVENAKPSFARDPIDTPLEMNTQPGHEGGSRQAWSPF